MSGLNPSPITIDELRNNLRIEAEFEGWCWNDRSNTLSIRLMLGDDVISTSSVTIEPAGYQREESEY